MGAYNRVNGEPCCGSYTLLRDILRNSWGFNGYVVSDCWAIKDFHMYHHVTSTSLESAALALDAGCDLNCGSIYLYLLQALDQGLITEDQITQAAERLFTTRYRLGLLEETEYDDIPYEVIECKEHTDLAVEAARKSIVLLKNNSILPINRSKVKTIGVIGPNANSRLALKGNYYGESSKYITILEGIQDEAEDDIRILYAKGCELEKRKTETLAQEFDRLMEAVTVAEHSDLVILCLGLDETLEGEERDEGNFSGSGDKKDLLLPEVQRVLFEKIKKTGKPIILCLMAGSAIDLSFADDISGVVQAWYPGARGGKAFSDILFGKCSPSGKLPVTFYRSLDGLPEFTDYSMRNRTYRFIKGEPLYPFGYGLTYGNVVCTSTQISPFKVEENIEIKIEIENQSDILTEDVIQVYIKDEESSNAVPNYSLCAFKRVELPGREKKVITLKVPFNALKSVDGRGQKIFDSSKFTFFIGTSQPDVRSVSLTGKKPLVLELNAKTDEKGCIVFYPSYCNMSY